MELREVDQETEATFLRCLHDEVPDDPRVTALRRRWYKRNKSRGLRARVLFNDEGTIVGLCQYIPIERSHLLGDGLMAILCIWVHGYEHGAGNQHGKGYGRFILEQIEADARQSGTSGVVAWGMDFPQWNPVSFYENMGYSRVDMNGPVVLVWKPFSESAVPPRLLRQVRAVPKNPDRTKVTVFVNGWCSVGCSNCISARDAVLGLEGQVTYQEIDTSVRENLLFWGIDDAVFVDDQPFGQDGPPWTSEELRGAILQAMSLW